MFIRNSAKENFQETECQKLKRETILFHDEDMIEEDEMYYDTEEDMFAEDVKIEDGPKLESLESYEDVMIPFSTGSTPPGTPPEHYVGSLPTELEVNTLLLGNIGNFERL